MSFIRIGSQEKTIDAHLLKQNPGITIIEVMIVMLVLSVGIMGSYQVASQGNNLERMSENRTKAVAFAREGLEIVENIRDTNWLKFSTNYEGCFDVRDYDIGCTNTTRTTPGSITRISSGSYTVSQDINHTWRLTQIPGDISETATGTLRASYAGRFPLILNANGVSTQSGSITGLPKCKNDLQTNCDTGFTREIRITRPGTDPTNILNPIQVKSIVTWLDGKQSKPYVIEMEYTLQNWKYQFYKPLTP